MRIAVIGAGGMGGYFGGRLARSGEAVAFVARGEHMRALQARGLTVRSVTGDFNVTVPVTDDPGRVRDLIGPVDLVLFCVKSWKPDTYSSLYQDLTHGRRLELEALQGHGVRLGAHHGLATPALFAVYAALRPSALAAESIT